ncbi:phage late control D family protein [Formicincola oecophyllae]|nr:contractile injection system protein, VgrG/Pvc8 family [Formicincola oecophyllae]
MVEDSAPTPAREGDWAVGTPVQGEERQRPLWQVSVNGQDVTGTLGRHLSSLTLTLPLEHSASTLDLVLADNPANPLELPALDATLEIALGWDGGVGGAILYPLGSFTLSALSSVGDSKTGCTLKLSATSAAHSGTSSGAMPTQGQQARSWLAGTTIGALVGTMAQELGLKPAVGAQLAEVALPHLDQVNESRLSFLQRLGRQHDATALPLAGRLVFLARGTGANASGQELPIVALEAAQTSHWELTRSEAQTMGTVQARYHDVGSATTHVVSVGEAKPAGGAAGSSGTGGSGTGGDDQPKPAFIINRTFRTKAEAEAAARAKLNELARQKEQLKLTLPGAPEIASGTIINLGASFRPAVAGLWQAGTITHQLDKKGGFTTILDQCKRPNQAPSMAATLSSAAVDSILQPASQRPVPPR